MGMIQLEATIRERAYAIWEGQGCPEGCEREHWEQAAREVLASRAEPAAKPARVAKSAGAKGRGRKAA